MERPLSGIHCEHWNDPRKCLYCGNVLPQLRDQFAMAALNDTQRQLTSTPKSEIEQMARARSYAGPMSGLVAICCYEMADAMMEARKTPGASTPSVTPKESAL